MGSHASPCLGRRRRNAKSISAYKIVRVSAEHSRRQNSRPRCPHDTSPLIESIHFRLSFSVLARVCPALGVGVKWSTTGAMLFAPADMLAILCSCASRAPCEAHQMHDEPCAPHLLLQRRYSMLGLFSSSIVCSKAAGKAESDEQVERPCQTPQIKHVLILSAGWAFCKTEGEGLV